jgi:hypothetical protein
MMSKNLVLMRDVITQYHPEFRKSKDLRAYGLQHPDIFNVERLVEESLAAVGPYQFIDAAHADFSDGTDSKTASIRVNPAVAGGRSHGGEISGVETAGGGRKIGALRCTIYNPHKDQLRYYFLPKRMWQSRITLHPSSGIGKIMYTYHREHDHIVKFHGYECASFVALAMAR